MGNKQSAQKAAAAAAQPQGVFRGFRRYRLTFGVTITMMEELTGRHINLARAKACVKDPETWQTYLEDTMSEAIERELGIYPDGIIRIPCSAVHVSLIKSGGDMGIYSGHIEWVSIACPMHHIRESMLNIFGLSLYYYGLTSLDSKWKLLVTPKQLTDEPARTPAHS